MPEKIGKYEVIERIGRGGMGMIYKAHDPVLDRSVALKVISSEIEVTDELRARFFREAKASAKLSHPNIVTVYDMGEHEGRLFIVMELLEGEELRRLITERRAMAIEDKLSVMLQVCEGLHYAHQNGVVHRDIKPANIFLLRNGQVKILDFGIAQIAKTDGLTRTGLMMGTLRYISPEQARGRADHRSDIFSIGAVFYEVLSFRPPFTGEDPMHLLEQLRTEEPPGLTELDPTIPPELAAIVQRALRKDPAERFPDLEQMGTQIEAVQRGLSEEAQRIRARARSQRDQVVQLQAALAERLGAPGQEEAMPPISERGGVVTMHALEGDFAGRVETLREKIARTDALAPAFQRATELLRAGQFSDAALEFEAIIADMPEHARAQEGLRQAHAQAEEQRRRQLAVELLQDARAAFDDGGYAHCLEILKQAAEIPPPAAMVQDVASLRQAAEAALEAQEAARRAQQLAERGREQMAEARRDAQGQDALHYASDFWREAEAKATEAQADFAQEAYAEAIQAFEVAATAYRQAQEAAREARVLERESAERAQEQMAQSHQQAQEADAAQYARELLDAADAKSAEARTAFGRRVLAHAIRAFDEASLLYRQAAEAARKARQQERQGAEGARGRAAQSRQSASAAGAERQAASLWGQASAKLSEAEAALEREQYANAVQGFDGAVALYRHAESEAGEARRRQRAQAEQGRQSMADARRSALAVDAASHAEAGWNEAEAGGAAAEAAFAREAYAEASQSFEQASALYRRAEETAREAARKRETERADADKAGEAASRARRVAVEAQASKYVAKQWGAAEAAEARASDAMSRQEYGPARSLFAEVRRLYAAAAQAAGVAAEAATRRADAMMGTATRLLESGDAVACLRRLDEVLALRPGHKAAEALRLRAEEKLRKTETAELPAEAAPHGVAETLHAQPPAALGKMIGQGETPAKVGAEAPPGLTRTPGVPPRPTELTKPPPKLEEPPTVLSEPPTVLAEPPTVLAEPPTVLAEPPTVLAEPPTAGIKTSGMPPRPSEVTAPPPKLAESPTVLVDQRTGSLGLPEVESRGESREAPGVGGGAVRDDATVLAGATAYVDATRLSSAEQRVGDIAPTRVRAGVPEVSRRTPTVRERFGTRAVAIALGGLAVIVGAVFYWLPQAPPVSPPAQQSAPTPKTVAPPMLIVRPAERPLAPAVSPPAQQAAPPQSVAPPVVVARPAAPQAGREKPVKERDGQTAPVAQQPAKREADAQAKREAEAKEGQAREEADARAKREADAKEAQAKRETDAKEAQAKRETEAKEAQAKEAARVVAALRSGLEQSHSWMATRRDQALKAEADRLAKDLFDVARTKHAEADRLASRQDFTAANHAYQDAADKYIEATLRAQFVREARAQADSAKTRMLAEKQRARQDSPEFKAALAEEKQGASFYEQLAFREAAERFRMAERLFTMGAVKLPLKIRPVVPGGPG